MAERPRRADRRLRGQPVRRHQHQRRRHLCVLRLQRVVRGADGLEAFKKDLAAWLTHTLAKKYNGKTAPRIVLFSPIAHEDLGNPHLPDGKENNGRLALYTKAMADVAPSTERHLRRSVHADPEALRRHRRAADDAGHPPEERRQPASSPRPSTARSSATRPSTRRARSAASREAVVDKDFYWFHRYRVDRRLLHLRRSRVPDVRARHPAQRQRQPGGARPPRKTSSRATTTCCSASCRCSTR